ncbi:O-antigen ligase family protein [Alicyclobacillus contaminans]|uniref:O-antigen ligase family protein n=1 Tax=Alicyclobacillus contaminans TaxID=392016 RepID=UPI00040A0081|nr:O-antigen ligase family protein [Alicyclobacillus contaminans]
MAEQTKMVEVNAEIGPIGLTQSRLARWSMYAVIAFPVIDYTLRHVPGLSLLGSIWDKLLLVVMAALAGVRYISGYRPRWLLWHRFAGWFLLLGLAVMFAGLASLGVSVNGLKMDVYYMLYAFLIPFLVAPEDVPRLLHAGAILAILIGLHGIYQYITKAPIQRGWTDVGETVRSRVYSVLQSPNELASYMALMTPLLAGMALYETHRIRKWIYGAGVLICGLTMLLTFTRAAWVALALAVFLMAVLFERRLLIALIVFVAVVYFLPPIHHRISDLLSPVYWIKSSQSGRIYRWVTAFDKMGTNPLFGIGTGRFGGAIASQSYGSLYSDNYYAKIMAEMGIVGLTLFVAMHIALIRDLFRRAIQTAVGRARYVLIGGTTGLIAMLIHNSMENVFEFAPNVFAYFTYATLFLIWVAAPVPDAGRTKATSAKGEGGEE